MDPLADSSYDAIDPLADSSYDATDPLADGRNQVMDTLAENHAVHPPAARRELRHKIPPVDCMACASRGAG